MNQDQVLKYSCYKMHMQVQHMLKERQIQIVDIKQNAAVCIIPLNDFELAQKSFDPDKYYISLLLQGKNEMSYIVFDAYLRIIVCQVKLDNKKTVFFALHQNCLITHEKGGESFYMYTYLDKEARCYKLKCNKNYFNQSYYETKQIMHNNRIVVQIINQGLSYIFDTSQVYQEKGGYKYIHPNTADYIKEETKQQDYDFEQIEAPENDSVVDMSISNTLQSYDSSLDNKTNLDAISNSKVYMKDFIFQQNGQTIMFGFADVKKVLTIKQIENKKIKLMFNQGVTVINNFKQLGENLLLRCGNCFSKVNFDTETYEVVAEISRHNYQNFKYYNNLIYAFDQYTVYVQTSYSEMIKLYSLDRQNHAHIRDLAFFGDGNIVILTKTHVVLVINNSEICIDIGRMVSHKYKDFYNLSKICVNYNKLYVKNQDKQVFMVKNFSNIMLIQKMQESIIKKLLNKHLPLPLIQQINTTIDTLTAKDVFTIKQIMQNTIPLEKCTSQSLLMQYIMVKCLNLQLLNKNMTSLADIQPLRQSDEYNVVDLRDQSDFLDFKKFEFLDLEILPNTKFTKFAKPTFLMQKIQVQNIQKDDDNFLEGKVQEFKVGEVANDDSWSDELPRKRKKLVVKLKSVEGIQQNDTQYTGQSINKVFDSFLNPAPINTNNAEWGDW